MYLQYVVLQNLASTHLLLRNVEAHNESPRQISCGHRNQQQTGRKKKILH